MISNPMIIFFFCLSLASINALETCPGASIDSQEDLTWKFNASSIVAYGKVTGVNGNTATLKIICPLKGLLLESTIQLIQAASVDNLSECHYLTANKDYIVFLEQIKSTTSNNNILYRLANLEEIEVTVNSLSKFIDDECNDEDDYGIPMTILYTDSNNKCGKFQVICNEKTKTSILNLSYPPLSKTSTFIGGLKNTVPVPNGMISGKQSNGIDDEILRGTATISTIFMPMVIIIASLTMIFNN